MTFRATSAYRSLDETFPAGVKLLLIATAGVFVLQQLLPAWFTLIFGLRPADVIGQVRLWQPLTYMFLHGGLLHLLFNLLVLWMMGGELERLWGRREFLRYYFVCGLGAAALAFVFAWDRLVIGASGAVFGVMVAFGLLFPDRTIYIGFVLPVPARWLVLFLFAFELLVIGRGDGVAHFAHVGGAITGFLYLRTGWRERLEPGRISRRWRRPRLRLHAGGAPPAGGVPETEIDRILDKISRSGLQSLTDEESRLLAEASRKYREGR